MNDTIEVVWSHLKRYEGFYMEEEPFYEISSVMK